MRLIASNAAVEVVGLEQLPGKSNYFIGNDPKKWRTNVATYAKVKYTDVYPGIDLIYHGNRGQLEYDFVASPGSDPGRIALSFGPPEKIKLSAQGDLVVNVEGGEVLVHKPAVYQFAGDEGQQTPVDGNYILSADGRIGFQVGAYDRARLLIIDPVVSYASFLGGSASDTRDSVSLAVDPFGNAYIAAGTLSGDFPVTSGAFQTGFAGGPAICDQGNLFCGDAFVTKINATGTAIVYSTYLGGSDSDYAFGLAVDAAGNAYVAGATKSTNFPVTPGAFQPTFGGSPAICENYICGDTFVAKLDSSGSSLIYSSYLGGSNEEYAEAIAVDSRGSAYVTGPTASADFPTTPGAFQTSFKGNDTCTGRSGATIPCHDIYVTKINPTGTQVVYSTFVGGTGDDYSGGIAVDASGHAYISGDSCSADFPITPTAFQTQMAGICDVIVAVLSATGNKLLYSTYIGGTGFETSYSVAVDPSGNAYAAGPTTSSDFPVTPGAVQRTFGGIQDGYVVKINPRLSGAASVVYSTYLGGSNVDWTIGVAADSFGNAFVSGATYSPDFPTVDPLQAANAGGGDVLIAELNPVGSALVFSTFLGGSKLEYGDFIALDPAGNIYVAGPTQSADFPATPQAFQPAFAGGDKDAFVVKITPINAPAVGFSPMSLTFGSEEVGSHSPPQTVILHNVGSATLLISSIRTTAEFSHTDSCGGILPGGGNCAITVTFTPSGQGTQAGALAVFDNAAGSPQKMTLAGTGK